MRPGVEGGGWEMQRGFFGMNGGCFFFFGRWGEILGRFI